MQKTLSNRDFSYEFVDYVVNDIAKPYLLALSNDPKIRLFSKEFSINAVNAFRKLVENIVIDKSSNYYTITISKARYNNRYSYKDLDTIFEWGNRNVKGWDIINSTIDDFFGPKADILYKMYLKGVRF